MPARRFSLLNYLIHCLCHCFLHAKPNTGTPPIPTPIQIVLTADRMDLENPGIVPGFNWEVKMAVSMFCWMGRQ